MTALRRLTLIATSSWRIPRGVTPANGALMDAVLEPGQPGNAWLCLDPDDGGAVTSVDGTAASALAHDIQHRIESYLDGQDGPASTLRHRLFLDAPRFSAITGMPVPAGIRYISIDFRLYQIRDSLSWHVSVALESGAPASARYRPSQLADTDPDPIRGPFAQWRKAFADQARTAERWLAGYFQHAEFRVLERIYLQPDFYIAFPASPLASPLEDPLMNEVVSNMLKVADRRDDVVSAAVLNGEFLVHRRISRAPSGGRPEYAPLYVIFPADGHEPAEQENSVRELVRAFADMEARGAALLDDLRQDLYVWRNHLDVYHTVAARGARLWDALATHMPVRRSTKLSRVHSAMELMHQMLLQGTADLAHLATRTHGGPSRVHATAAELSDLYDDTFTEQPLPGYSGIRASLTETGLIGRIARSSQEVAGQATLVQQNYDDLLEAITKAFDERRVREGDALQRSNVVLSISLGLVGVVTVADATVNLRGAGPWWLGNAFASHFGAWLSLAIGFILLSSALFMVGRLVRAGKLGSREFRIQYDQGLWGFLRDSCTERLEDFKDRAGPADWPVLDRELAGRFAALWDEATNLVPIHQSGQSSRDIGVLSYLIEQWCLHGLLATERARRMYRYSLPRLTSLYRVASEVPGSFLQLRYLAPTPDPVSIVSSEEFSRTVADSLAVSLQDARAIEARLVQAKPKTATAALALLDGLLPTAVPAQRKPAGGNRSKTDITP